MDKKLETTFRKALKAVKDAKTSKGSKQKTLEARKWARIAIDGDYLVDWDMSEEDVGSRGGYSDPELAEINRILNQRGLKLMTDDKGICAGSKYGDQNG